MFLLKKKLRPARVIFDYSEGLAYTGINVALRNFLLGAGIFILKPVFLFEAIIYLWKESPELSLQLLHSMHPAVPWEWGQS